MGLEEVLETSAAVGGEEEGQILPLADMTVPQQQQRQKQKTDRLEVSPAPYLCSAPVEPLRLPLPPRGLHALPSISRFLSPLPVFVFAKKCRRLRIGPSPALGCP